MKIEAGLFSKRDRKAESIARARADIEAGRVVDHADVAAWLKTWGTDQERPIPPEWLE